MVGGMRNITNEASATVRARYGRLPPIPPRGVEGCNCLMTMPSDQLIALADQSDKIVWYARKNCPIHGITITDQSASPATATSSV